MGLIVSGDSYADADLRRFMMEHSESKWEVFVGALPDDGRANFASHRQNMGSLMPPVDRCLSPESQTPLPSKF